MDEEQFEALAQKMDLIGRLLALNLIREAKTDKERIIKLSSAGLKPKEIAALLGIKDTTVNNRLSEGRKEKKKPRKKGKRHD